MTDLIDPLGLLFLLIAVSWLGWAITAGPG